MDLQRWTSPDEQQHAAQSLHLGWELAGLSIEQLWVTAISLSGQLSESDVAAILTGAQAHTPHEHNVLAQALNEHFIDQGGDHPVPYADDLDTC